MCDHRRVFDTGNDLDLATATFTGFDVDIENSLDYCADCGLEELLKNGAQERVNQAFAKHRFARR